MLLVLLSHFSRVRLCVTPETAAHQAPPSLGFSRQERWSGLPFPSPMHEREKWKWNHSVVSNPQRPHGLQPSRLLHPWDFPGDADVFYSTAAPWTCCSHLDKFPESWQPELMFHWGVFTPTQLFSSRSRKSTRIQLILCCNKETSPRETVAELILMMRRRITTMIMVINITITRYRLIEGTYFSPGFVYTVAIFHAPVREEDHAQLEINCPGLNSLRNWQKHTQYNSDRWWEDNPNTSMFPLPHWR